MALVKGESYVLGLDYGSDSCRAVLLDAADGSEAAVSVMYYPRWKEGLYCDAKNNQFRQHPLDYIEVLEGTVRDAVKKCGADTASKVKGIAIDTTGSTPCAVDAQGTPLALKPEFAENPSAMFVLWKDHTSVDEAGEITHLAKNWGGIDYTRYMGGIYSSEWFWAKIMRVFKEDSKIAENAVSFLEHCDWMTFLLSGQKDIKAVKRSRCAMGHKAMWHGSFDNGYPSENFFNKLDPKLVKIRESLGNDTYTSDQIAGHLSPEWADRLGLPAGIPIAVGAYDAHMGAVGGGVKPLWLVRVMGTSTCDIIVGPKPEGEEIPVKGICGQVDGSVIPGMIGYEAGQSSFGDVYAWFKNVLAWPLDAILPGIDGVDPDVKEKIAKEVSDRIIPVLELAAEKIDPLENGITALDWLNGRRTPDANQRLKGAIEGFNLGSDAAGIYRALAEATTYGARAIVERFREEGVKIEGIIGIGGVARKSPLVMQIISDVLNMPIHAAANDQCMALGAAMFASVAAGLYPDLHAAQEALSSPIEKIYQPNPERVKVYNELYKKYLHLGSYMEKQVS